MKINERLKQLRKDNGLTQTELSKKLNIGQTTIAAYENGTHDPQIFSLIAYADFFGCSVDFLLGRAPDFESNQPYAPQRVNVGEQQLIEIYRSLNADMKDMLVGVAKVMAQPPASGK